MKRWTPKRKLIEVNKYLKGYPYHHDISQEEMDELVKKSCFGMKRPTVTSQEKVKP